MYDEETRINEMNKNKMPFFIWIISLRIIIGLVFSVYSFYLIQSGAIHLSDAQMEYFRNQNITSHIFSIALGLLNITGVVLLIMLKKAAVVVFLASYIINILLSVYHYIIKDLVIISDFSTSASQVIGWGINTIIIIYILRLNYKKILK